MVKRKTIGFTLVLMTSGLGARPLDPAGGSPTSRGRGPAGFDDADWIGRRTSVRDSARRQREDLSARSELVEDALAEADALFSAESEDGQTLARIAEMTSALEAIAVETEQRREEYDLLVRDFTKLAGVARDICAQMPETCDPRAEDLSPAVCAPDHPAGLTCSAYLELKQTRDKLASRERRYRAAIGHLKQRGGRAKAARPTGIKEH